MATASGFSTHAELYASMFRQGGRTVYNFDLSPEQLTYLVPRPNPDAPVESNREIRPKHAEDFADYFIDNEAWVIPGIILRTVEKIDFTVTQELGGTKFGLLRIPRTSSFEIYTLDGQHRTLGFFIARDKLLAQREAAAEELHAAKRQYPGSQAEHQAQDRLERVRANLARLESERFAVQVYVEENPQAYRQMFYDIADNALGITAAVRARFDSRKVINRALPDILEHPLLKGRVEMEVDVLAHDSPKYILVKNIVEVVKNLLKGFHGRMSKNDNKNMRDEDVAQMAIEFFDDLVDAFPPLKALELGQITAQQVRETTLLGSPRFMRLLAGVYFDLRSPAKKSRLRKDVQAYLHRLAAHVSSDGTPIYPGSVWVEHMPEGAFLPRENDLAPTPSLQTQALHTMLDWEVLREPDLTIPPPPRPADADGD